MRVVITGARGQLGRGLIESFQTHDLLPIDLPGLPTGLPKEDHQQQRSIRRQGLPIGAMLTLTNNWQSGTIGLKGVSQVSSTARAPSYRETDTCLERFLTSVTGNRAENLAAR